MQSLFRRFPLYVTVTAIAGVPIVLAIILALTFVSHFNTKANQTLQDSDVVTLIVLYDNLAHNLAVERGLTAGVLGSKGKGPQVAKLAEQRKKVDTHASNLLGSQSLHIAPKLTQDLIQNVRQQLGDLNEVRRQVDTLKPTLSPFSYYSNINQLAIDNAALLLSQISTPEVSRLGESLIAVMTMKERAGQVRGALNGVFARKSATAGLYSNIQNYLESGHYAQRNATLTMPSEFINELNKAEANSAWQQVEDVQRDFLAQKNTLDRVEGPQASSWFAAATSRIKLINGVRNLIQQKMITLSVSEQNEATYNKYLTLTTTLILSLALIFSLFICVRMLRSTVGSATKTLAIMSQNRDLSQSLDESGKDEISQISTSVNQLTTNIRVLLGGVTDTNANSLEKLESIVSGSQHLVRSSQETSGKCANIAAAMTQLTQSSTDIAGSANSASLETEKMNQQVEQCLTQSETSFDNVQSLSNQIDETQQCMEELEKDAQSVSSIVSTIGSISEQTNLLALNAAIESARAGEHGRGFAVVSSEVRDLAQRSKEATEDISALLDKISTNTARAVENMRKSNDASQHTFTSVNSVKDSVSQLEHVIEAVGEHINSIANATTEQSKASEAVDQDIDNLNEISDRTGSLASEMTNTVISYQQEVDKVQSQLGEFKLHT
ncbi:methyl-accepting chemotaxis protein [Vibrio tapetis]|uniref:Methyl-accepting chemotaxis protein n=1 Tax=Vibrio tapetis subsp. tapetis TaxID=1671868 RepID=A0A2N8Z986_9VIBR|nr:methyl-accepting chemotaxis protein [Vibrio tapetis]SON48478.1 Methyl-accepting chemotaxis protein [Vibrio tapetis subsp. tapetis]